MKHIFTLLYLLGIVSTTCAQKSKRAPVITRFYQLTGTIGKYPVTFNLHREGDELYGTYYCDSTEEIIEVHGTLNTNTALKIFCYYKGGEADEELTGIFKDSIFTGTWNSKGKELPFCLTQSRNTNGLHFDYVTTKGSKSLPKNQGYSRGSLTYDGSAVCPTPSSTHPAAKYIKETIFNAFNHSTSGTIGEAMLSEKKEVLSQAGDIEIYGVSQNVSIVYWSKQMLTLSTYAWEDNGGAHGNYTVKYTNFDLGNNSEAGAIFNECDQLPALKEKKLREFFNASEDKKLSNFLLVDTLPEASNCIITSKGI
ncbi:MAG TPA: hypothetical protein VM187_03420, partial [Niastella sp.]|nr:hypothetical protein [Niastella sp.]